MTFLAFQEESDGETFRDLRPIELRPMSFQFNEWFQRYSSALAMQFWRPTLGCSLPWGYFIMPGWDMKGHVVSGDHTVVDDIEIMSLTPILYPWFSFFFFFFSL